MHALGHAPTPGEVLDHSRTESVGLRLRDELPREQPGREARGGIARGALLLRSCTHQRRAPQCLEQRLIDDE